ncbi:MAG: glycosyltransferase family 4 protein [Bacteroidota bacterium]|nr:glycosyltransferase family 4 protein [Bacteroidota bacterium]
MIKVTYIISDTDQAIFFENTFRLIDKSRFAISVILLNPGNTPFEETLVKENIPHKRIRYTGKKDYPRAIIQAIIYLRKIKPDIVHTHLANASVIGLFAAKIAGVKKRIYTRHGGTQKFFFDKGKKYDKAVHYMATHIIATCENVKEVLMEEDHVAAGKITIVNLAFETEKFANPDPVIVEQLKQKYNPHARGPVIGVISRWAGYKGIQYILPAFKELLKTFPNALLILANARGNYAGEIQKMVDEFRPEEITAIPFENNIYELYQLFDVFVHVPVGKHYEAFGQIYIEALAGGIPSVVTMAGIAPELIRDRYNALVVDYKNSEQIAAGLVTILTDHELRKQIIQNGKASVQNRFDYSRYINELETMYTNTLDNKNKKTSKALKAIV